MRNLGGGGGGGGNMKTLVAVYMRSHIFNKIKNCDLRGAKYFKEGKCPPPPKENLHVHGMCMYTLVLYVVCSLCCHYI